MVHLAVCSYDVTYAFQSESTFYSCLTFSILFNNVNIPCVNMVSKIAGFVISVKLIHNMGLSKQTGQAAQSSN